jgi:hypothetical protein
VKILLVNDYAVPQGGAEILILNLRDALRERGHDARLFASNASEDASRSLADYTCRGTTSRFRTLLQSANPWAAMRLRRVLTVFQPDVVDYGRWTEPVTGGVIDDIPGHNSSWKRALLLEYGSELESMLPAPTFLNWDLQAKGHQLYLEPSAKVHHLQVSSAWACLVEQFHVARLFPAERSRNWPWSRRLFYVCGMPVLLNRNLRGWLDHFRRIDSTGRTLAKAWPFLLLIIFVWGIGEIIGYSLGIGLAGERTLCFDTHRDRYLNRRDRELLAAE